MWPCISFGWFNFFLKFNGILKTITLYWVLRARQMLCLLLWNLIWWQLNHGQALMRWSEKWSYRRQNFGQKWANVTSFVLLCMHCSLSVHSCLFMDSLDKLAGIFLAVRALDGQYNTTLKLSHTGIMQLGFKYSFAPWASCLTPSLSAKQW